MTNSKRFNFRIIFLGITVLIVLGLLLSACGSGDSKTVVTTGAGETKQQKAELPANFPADFPVPPGKLVFGDTNLDRGGVVVYLAAWRTPLTPADALASYQNDLPSRGWQILQVDAANSKIVFKRPQDKLNSTLKVKVVDGKTLVQVAVY